jgi:valyl-tRNA synthetase
MELPKRYDPKTSEPKWQQFWADNNIFKFDENNQEKVIFSIDTPPPTISGKMHLGHAFSFAQQDFIARFKRMQGFNVFYPFGTDDNGLATDKLVQKTKKVSAKHMPRDEYIKICNEYLQEERPKFIQDWKNIGMSCDFSISYSTIDDNSRKIAQKTFLDLIQKGLAYRKEAPVIWDTMFQSAIAQAELEDIEKTTFFNDIIFKLDDNTIADEKEKELIISTTRPELLGACVALFAHPEDKRYQKYFGKFALSPLYNAKVPIMPDEKADPEKGSGMVMCCTFGDQTDIEWFKKHNLPLKMVITKAGKMNQKSGKYDGLKIEDARKEIIKDLKEANLLTDQKEIKHTVNVGERSGKPVEIINSKQWYIKYLDQKDNFLKSANKLIWHPPHMKHRVDNWIKGLNWDWSIARQRSYGIPIPVWYDNEGKQYFADETQLPVDPTKDRPLSAPENIELTPETDVFDTWFTSASTPFLSTYYLKDKPVYKKLFPMDLRPQGHDIINFWLFYTMAKTNLLHQVNPWKIAAISGWILDPKGNKMSKSKGNVIAPQDVISKFSADAIRYAAGATKLGEDIPYQEKEVLTGQKFVNKLWNSFRFAMMFLEDYKHQEIKQENLETFDIYLLSKLNETIKIATTTFNEFSYSKAKKEIENFFWQTFCDNYLEIVKDRLYNPQNRGEKEKQSAQYTLYTAINAILKLMAPFTPYVTEEIYQLFFKKEEKQPSIHQANYPKYNKENTNTSALEVGDRGLDIISEIRKYKSQNNLSMKEEINELTIISEKDLSSIESDLKAVLNVKNILYKGETSLETDKFSINLGILR